MEAPLLVCFLNTILTKVLCLAEEKYKVYSGIKYDLEFLERELSMISAFIDVKLSSKRDELPEKEKISIENLRKVSHGIEDCIDSLMYLAIRKKQAPLRLQVRRYLSTQQSIQEIAEEMKRLRDAAEEEQKRRERYKSETTSSAKQPKLVGSCSSSSWSDLPAISAAEDDPVGIEATRDELVKHLAEETHGFKVVTIVGLAGSGKTFLARAVYNSEFGRGFDLHACVNAAERAPGEVLMEIFDQLGAPRPAVDDVGKIKANLRETLTDKRSLIVIDDMQAGQWDTIADALPDNGRCSIRILVSTTVQTVANTCCSSNGYLHKMRKLDDKESKALFLKKACPNNHYLDYADRDSRQILDKCDGQALALVTVGQYLRETGWPTKHKFYNACQEIRREFLEAKTMETLRRVLVRTYARLSEHAPRACLMYFGMFACDRPVRRKNLMRLWLAEGFLEAKDSCGSMVLADKNFNKLIDYNIIEPIDMSNNNKVKTCKTYGMMHEFILIKSISQDFVALFGNEKLKRKPCIVRRLSLHNSNVASETNLDIDFSVVRSLTVFGETRRSILEFHKYKLLRVLDLEECTNDLGKKNLKDICKLRLLKYLSLGVTVTQLPKQIEKLTLLQTLDLRRTKVEKLPIEVLLLPCLIHLYGRFQLSKVKKISEVPKFLLSGQSQLETLAGFVTDKNNIFAHIMSRLKRLSKAKIWCEGTTSNNFAHLVDAIQEFIHYEGPDDDDARSLSLHMKKFPVGFLDSLEGPGHLRSLKLQGKLVQFPEFVRLLHGLEELCLQSTILSRDVLAKLSGLKHLKYLKLIANELEEFTISDESFPWLLRICLEVQCRCPTLPKIEKGALKYLISLRVICKYLVGLCDLKLEYLPVLEDVTLHAVDLRTQKEWEEAANNHPNRPKILLLDAADQTIIDPSDDSVASQPSASTRMEIAVLDGPALNDDTQMLLNHRLGSPSSA